MHLHLLLAAFTVALLIRCRAVPRSSAQSWCDRWQRTLFAFLFPPLLLIMTAIAVLCMGRQGQMLGLPVGAIGYLLALSFLLTAVGLAMGLLGAGWRSLHALQVHPPFRLADTSARLLNSPLPFAAQIGFWQPQLVVSQGLLDRLDPDQLDAVLTHEQAHVHFRDTFWFFWLGWVRHLTAWLPRSQTLWAELVLLREIRADGWAAQRVDPLLLAETLLLLVKLPLLQEHEGAVAFDTLAQKSHLHERIDALLEAEAIAPRRLPWGWVGFLLAATPLLTLLLHHF